MIKIINFFSYEEMINSPEDDLSVICPPACTEVKYFASMSTVPLTAKDGRYQLLYLFDLDKLSNSLNLNICRITGVHIFQRFLHSQVQKIRTLQIY